MKMSSFRLPAAALAVGLLAASAHGAVQQDVLLNNSSQIVTMSNNPFFATQQDIAGVNFYYNGSGVASGSTVNGVGFDNINLTGNPPPTGPFALYANVPGITFNFGMNVAGGDQTERTQNLAAAGPDASTLNAVANRMFYVGAPVQTSASMSFNGLGANRNVYVQLIGGDSGWNGDLAVTANGGAVGTWTTVADSSSNNGSLFAFDTTTSATGALDLGFSIAAGNYAGISGIVVSGEGTVAAPPPPTQAALTSTAQILAPDAAFDTLAAAVNFRYSNQSGVAAPGSVNGIDFQDIDWLGGTQALSQGGDITITTPGGTERARFQNTAATISGADEGVLESIANTINYLGAGESTNISLTGLEPNADMRIQIIAGDAGTSLGNWLGDFDVTVNGDSTVWDVVTDDDLTTASLLNVVGTTDAAGNLQITLDQINGPPGQFAGIAGLTVTQAAAAVPEPSSIALWSLIGVAGLIGFHWRRRRS